MIMMMMTMKPHTRPQYPWQTSYKAQAVHPAEANAIPARKNIAVSPHKTRIK